MINKRKPKYVNVFLVAFSIFLVSTNVYVSNTFADHGCTGDCNNNNEVTIDEVMKSVNIYLGTKSLLDCPMDDSNNDTKVSINEVMEAVNNFLSDGCPVWTPTSTFTKTATRTNTPMPTPTGTAIALSPGCLWAAAIGPFGVGQSDQNVLTEEQIRHYVDLAPSYSKGIRFFGTRGGLQYGPPYAKQIGMFPIISGVFVNNNQDVVADQLVGLRDVVRDSDYVVVGSNATNEQNVGIDQLLNYACRAKEIVQEEHSSASVTIGERWDVYLAFQTKIKQAQTRDGTRCIDVVFGYRQPFYDADRPDVQSMVDRVVEAYKDLDGAYDIPVYIGETGMPGAPDADIISQLLDKRATLENQKVFWEYILNHHLLQNRVVGYQINDEEWLCGFEKHLCRFGFYYSNLVPKWPTIEAFRGDCTFQ